MWESIVRAVRDHLVLWLALVPMAGAIAMSVSRRSARRLMRVNLTISLALCVWLISAYEPLKPASSPEQAAFSGPIQRFQFRDGFNWVGAPREQMVERARRDGSRGSVAIPIRWGPDIRCEVGVDGISLWFIVLSVLLVGVAALKDDDWTTDPNRTDKVHSSAAWLWLEASLIGAFAALDVVLFVVCWSSSLLALANLLARQGDSSRHEAVPRFLYGHWVGAGLALLGLCGSVLTFGWLRETPRRPEAPLLFSIPELAAGIEHWTTGSGAAYLWAHASPRFFGLLMVGCTWPLFLVPFHRRFVAVVDCAPISVVIVLVGLFTKLGIYGWLRFVLPVFPRIVHEHGGWLTTIVALSSLCAAWLAFGQSDWRRRIAYATTSSLGLSLLALLTQTSEGLAGGVLRVLSHGITAALLLWLLGIPNSATKTDAHAAPPNARHRGAIRFALFAWIGFPGLSGFVPEILTPFGMIQHDFNAAIISLATSGMIAWMWVRAEHDAPLAVVNWSTCDRIVIGSLIALNVAMGLWPQFVIDQLQPSLLSLMSTVGESPAGSP